MSSWHEPPQQAASVRTANVMSIEHALGNVFPYNTNTIIKSLPSLTGIIKVSKVKAGKLGFCELLKGNSRHRSHHIAGARVKIYF
jgi:hypothetical protein